MNVLDSLAVSRRGPSGHLDAMPSVLRAHLPDYCALLAESNGIEIHGGLFRVFGLGPSCLGRDCLAWNGASWRTPYLVPTATIFWGENIFGDQYGLNTESGALVMLHCEGGHVDVMRPFETVVQYLEEVVLGARQDWIEAHLAQAAAMRGLRPGLLEHLSFELPLICGGNATEDNLEVMDGAAHLDLLGQLIEQSRIVPEGTRIRGFRG